MVSNFVKIYVKFYCKICYLFKGDYNFTLRREILFIRHKLQYKHYGLCLPFQNSTFVVRTHLFQNMVVSDCLISSRFSQIQQHSVLKLQRANKVPNLITSTQPAGFYHYKIAPSDLIINKAKDNCINKSILEKYFLKYQVILQRV